MEGHSEKVWRLRSRFLSSCARKMWLPLRATDYASMMQVRPGSLEADRKRKLRLEPFAFGCSTLARRQTSAVCRLAGLGKIYCAKIWRPAGCSGHEAMHHGYRHSVWPYPLCHQAQEPSGVHLTELHLFSSDA